MGASTGNRGGAARRLLGLADSASLADVHERYLRLKQHVEERARASDDEEFVAAREAEIALLDSIAGGAAAPSGRGPLWLWLWAIGASAAVAVLGLTSMPAEAPDPAADAAPPRPASISVQAEPAGALLEVFGAGDERLIATAPADGRPHSVDAGDYALRVSHPDCPDTWSRDATLTPGDRIEYAPRICRGQGEIIVRSNLQGDRVQIDGLDVGTSGELGHPVAVGAHEVQVTKQGYLPWTAQVKIAPDQALTLRAELEPDPEAKSGPSATAQAPAGGSLPQASPQPSQHAQAPPPVADAAGEEGGRVYRGPSDGPMLDPDIASMGRGGSKSWHDAIKDKLIGDYDADRSGSLDTPDEVNAIPCKVWKSIEASYETGGLRVDMARLYGFDGSKAPANTLGISEPMRGYAYARMEQCGLKTPV